MRADTWLVASSAGLLGSAGPFVPEAVLATLVGAVLITWGGVSRRALAMAALCAVGCWHRAALLVDDFEARRVVVRDQLGPPTVCAGRGRVVVSPVRVGDALRSTVEFAELDCDGRALRLETPMRAALFGGPVELTRGSEVFVLAKLGALRMFRNAVTNDPAPSAARRDVVLSGGALSVEVLAPGAGIGALIDRARAFVRGRIERTFAPAAAPLARALVLGENDLTDEDADAFRRSGLSHLLAVSGTHLVFAVVALVGALRAMLLRCQRLSRRLNVTRVSSAAGVFLALVYADFSGGSGSAWRAAWMLVLVFTARVFERRPCPVRVFALTMLVGALIDPLLVFDISFMLSLGATAGLLVLGRPWVARAERIQSVPVRFVVVSLAATTATMLPCTPILAVMSPELTLVGLAANVVAAPIGELVALPVCLTHAIASPFPALETGLGLVGSGALLAVRHVALTSASVEVLAFSSVDPSAWHLGLALLGAFALLRDRLRPSHARASAFVWGATLAIGFHALEAGIRRPLRDGRTLRVSMLDVGQGDATLLETPSNEALLVDAGGFVGSPVNPGARVIAPWLRARRTGRLSVVALSHPHPDHFGGLRAVVEQVRVGEFWDTGQGEAEGAGPEYAALLRALRERGVPIRRPDELCGRPRYFGAVRVDVLAPCPSFTPKRDANDNSLVLRVSYGKRRFLLTGDAERHQEHELEARYGHGLAADVLKVGHHGSRTSTTPAFLELVAPSFASISCGVRNSFGHPHAESVSALSRAGVGMLRTDRTGSLTFVTNGEQLDLYAFSFPR